MYINSRQFYCEIIISKAKGTLTEEAKEMFILLADNIIIKFFYENEMDREDCYQTALYTIFKNWHNFDPDKSNNVFAYFTEIIKRGIAMGWRTLNKNKTEDVILISIDAINDGQGMHNI